MHRHITQYDFNTLIYWGLLYQKASSKHPDIISIPARAAKKMYCDYFYAITQSACRSVARCDDTRDLIRDTLDYDQRQEPTRELLVEKVNQYFIRSNTQLRTLPDYQSISNEPTWAYTADDSFKPDLLSHCVKVYGMTLSFAALVLLICTTTQDVVPDEIRLGFGVLAVVVLLHESYQSRRDIVSLPSADSLQDLMHSENGSVIHHL